jgi:putative ABC transport system permease protein
MKLLASLGSVISTLFHRSRIDGEMDEELRSHIQNRADDLERSGMSRREAERRARIEFGGYQKFREECRETLGIHFIDALVQDVRYGLRTLARNPGFTFFAVAVLALGIAANTAIFTIADAVLVRPLPYLDAGALVMVWEDASSYGFPRDTPAPGNFYDWKSRSRVFDDMAASHPQSFNLTGGGNPEEIDGKSVTANLFSVLGVNPILGRAFRPDDDVPGAAHVAILSHGLWLRRFGGDPKTVGTDVWLSGEKYTVVGVMGKGFQYPDRETQIWVPAQFTKTDLTEHGSHFLNVIARLKVGVSLKTANANLATIAAQLQKEYPDSNAKVGAYAVRLRTELAGSARPAILALLGAVFFVLLIACANVANLVLARASGRRRELAMRLALGAGRSRIIRQMLTESVLLAAIAGGAGLTLSVWGTQFLASLIPAGFAPLATTRVNTAALSFTVGISLATGILFGIIPALLTSRLDLATSLTQAGGPRGGGSGGRRLRDALVVCEVAVAIILLTGATLMIRSFEALYHHDPGFRADHVLVMRTSLPRSKYAEFTKKTAFFDQVLARVGAFPGVVAAGYTSWVPLTNYGGATGISVEGRPASEPGQMPIPNIRMISQNYLQALRIKLIEGRMFDERDEAGSPLVALINQTMARNLWSGEDSVGKRFKPGRLTESSPWITVVGVVGDVHQAGLDVPARQEMYMPYQQQDLGFTPEYLAVRTAGAPMSMAETIRAQIWAVDKEQPVAGVMPLADLVDEYLAPWQVQASLLGGFAAIAVLLASLGIYAVLSFSVTQQTQEIGVRVALGARPHDVFRGVLSYGLKLFLRGAVIGLAFALALSRAMVHLLYGVTASDPISFASVTIVLAAVTLLAGYIPARRAMRVDPMVALRYE